MKQGKRVLCWKDVAGCIERNTYGGDRNTGKHERKVTRQMPKVASYSGIKLEWGRGEEEYPIYISVQMTDDKWVRYQIHREQPEFSPALEAVANMQRGYPPKRP